MVAAVAVDKQIPRDWLLVRRLDEPGPDGFRRSWIMLFPVGKFSHPEYGTLNFSRARLAEIKQNFDARVRHIDVALDANHDQDKATGWLEQVQLRDGGLWGQVRWTPLGERYLRDQIYRYFSPEFGDWKDPQTSTTYHDVLMGGALTNRPFLKEMPAVQLAGGEVSTRAWGSVDKSKLPDSCFLDPKNRRLPIYEGAGPIVDGKYTKRGKLNINAVDDAIGAMHGSRSGKNMTGLPAGTMAKLQRLKAHYGGGDSASQEASEGGDEVMGTTYKLMGKGSSSGSLVGGPLGPHDVGGDMGDECEEPEGGAAFADGADDGDGADDDGFDKKSNTHGPMTTDGHTHGKYAEHSHDGDADHSDAELADTSSMAYAEPDESDGDDEQKASRGGKALTKKATDPVRGITLAEATKRLREVEYRLYERDVEGVVASLTEKLPEHYALSKVLTDKLRTWLLGSGYQLSESRRADVLDIIKLAISDRALVDTQRAVGASFDQEARVTIRRGGQQHAAGQNGAEAENRLVEFASMLALSEKKADGKTLLQRGQQFTDLPMADRERLMAVAAKEIGYK